MSTSPNLSKKAEKLLQSIRHMKGGVIPEEELQAFTKLSHGSLLAARHELMDKGLLAMGRKDGKPAFVLLAAEAPESPSSADRSTANAAESAAPSTSNAPQAETPAKMAESQAAGGKSQVPQAEGPATIKESQAAAPAEKPAKKAAPGPAPATARKKSPRKEKAEPAVSFAAVKPAMPLVTGEFGDFDEWNDALVDELGDVEIDPVAGRAECYSVYSPQYEQEQRYSVTSDGLRLYVDVD